MYSSQNAHRSSTLPLWGPSGPAYPPQMPVPNSSIYQPQQQAPYISTQSTQPPFTHQTFNNASASAHAPSGPVSYTPPFPTPFILGGHTSTNSGPPPPSTPPRAGTMPLPSRNYNAPESNVTRPPSHLWMQQEPLVTGNWGPRDDRSESDKVSPSAAHDGTGEERMKAPPVRPSAGIQRENASGGHGQTSNGQTAGAEPEGGGCGCCIVM